MISGVEFYTRCLVLSKEFTVRDLSQIFVFLIKIVEYMSWWCRPSNVYRTWFWWHAGFKPNILMPDCVYMESYSYVEHDFEVTFWIRCPHPSFSAQDEDLKIQILSVIWFYPHPQAILWKFPRTNWRFLSVHIRNPLNVRRYIILYCFLCPLSLPPLYLSEHRISLYSLFSD